MSGLARTALLVLVGVAAGGSIGCARRGEPVATVIDSRGTVERAEGAETFRAAGPGQVFVVGDTLRTRAASQARLRLTNGTVLRVLENARIRFARGALPAARGADVNIELGAAEVESATEELALVTPLGVARVQRGARVRISSDGERSTLEVVVGRAVVLGSAGELILDQGQGARIKAGEAGPERYDLLIGRPIVETPAAGAAAPAQAAPPPVGRAAPETPAAATPDDGRQRPPTARADITLEAGDSGTVHITARTVALRLAFERLCDEAARVEIHGAGQRRTLSGSGSLVLKARPGPLRYILRCAGDAPGAKPRAAGSLTIKRDGGDAPVSRRAPANALDADGRRYTVLFQTRLPALTLGWTAAPAGAKSLALHLESAAGTRTFAPAATATRQLASGALGEGSYVWWYASEDGRTSPKTTVTIRFDNAAPTAQFFSGRAGAEPAGGGLVSIDGMTIDGAKVSAGGRSLPVDEHGRFRGLIAPPSGDDAVVVRLEHPRTGIHYYVRQAGSRRQARGAHAR